MRLTRRHLTGCIHGCWMITYDRFRVILGPHTYLCFSAYSCVSPLSSLPARFDSLTMHNCITHHHTSLFSTSLSPPSHPCTTKYDKKNISADGGRDCLAVSSAGPHTFFFFSCYSCILFSSVGRCVVLCTVCICVCLSIHVCRSVWEEENVMSVHLTYINYFLCFYVFCDTKISIEIK